MPRLSHADDARRGARDGAHALAYSIIIAQTQKAKRFNAKNKRQQPPRDGGCAPPQPCAAHSATVMKRRSTGTTPTTGVENILCMACTVAGGAAKVSSA